MFDETLRIIQGTVRNEQVWYSARSWKKPIWCGTTRSVMFDDGTAQLEKANIGEYLFTPGTCVSGMDNFKSVARDVIRKLEK